MALPLVSKSGQNIQATRREQWPAGWPDVEYMLEWGSQIYAGQPTHSFEPITEADRQCIAKMIPEVVLVNQPSAFLVFARTCEQVDEVNFPFIRYHCTNMWAAQSILHAEVPFKNKVLVGFAMTQKLVGVYVSETAAGALYYAHGSKSLRGLCALLILQSVNSGEKLSSKNNRVLKSMWQDGHAVVGAIFFRSFNPPLTNQPELGKVWHSLKYASDEQIRACGERYRQHCFHAFGCDDKGLYVFETKSASDIFTEWPKIKPQFPIFELQVSPIQEQMLQSIVSAPFPPASTASINPSTSSSSIAPVQEIQAAGGEAPLVPREAGQSRDVHWWRDHQVLFEGWKALPEGKWYCRTKSDRVCIWDSSLNKTVWPAPECVPPLPSPPTLPIEQLEPAPSQVPRENISSDSASASGNEDLMEAIEGLIEEAARVTTTDTEPVVTDHTDNATDIWGELSPRLRNVIKERLHALQRSDVPVLAERLKKSGWSSILCANLWKSPLEAQQDVLLLGDPGRVRTLCGELYVACKLLCERLRAEKVQRFSESAQPSTKTKPVAGTGGQASVSSSSSSSGPLILPPGVSPALSTVVGTQLPDELKPLVEKMWQCVLSVADLCPVGKTLSKAPQHIRDKMKDIFMKQCISLTPATAKLRLRAFSRWISFCDEVGIPPFPMEAQWLAVFLHGTGSAGNSVPATMLAQIKVWGEWLSVTIPTDAFVMAAVTNTGSYVEPKQAEPLSPALLWFFEWCLSDPRDVVVWISAVWLLLAIGTMRFVHVSRSCITHATTEGFFGFCYLGKTKSGGKRAPFRWCCPRKMPGGTDLYDVFMKLMATHKLTSTVDDPKGLMPDVIPARAPFDTARGFSSSCMKLHRFHTLSRQIVQAARPGYDTTRISSYSARRLMPSVAELWHVPAELRNKIGGWNKDEVREQARIRMPDHYSHFKLQSSLHIKNAVVNSLSNLCGAIRVADESVSWPELCSRTTCDVAAWKVDEGVPVPGASKSGPQEEAEVSDSNNSSSSSSSTSSSCEPISKRRCDSGVMLPWVMAETGSVFHVRNQDQPYCAIGLQGKQVQTGSTRESAIATGRPLCNNCWRKLDVQFRKLWVGDIA